MSKQRKTEGYPFPLMSRVQRLRIAVLALVLAAGAGPAQASKVYERLPVIPAAPVVVDGSLESFRSRVLAAVVAQDRKALAVFLGRGFFWERDFGGAYRRQATPEQNLAAAFGIGRDATREGQADGWRRLRRALSSETATALQPGRADVCFPGAYRLGNRAAAEKTAAQLDTELAFDWGVVPGETVPVRATAGAAAEVVGTLSREAVRVLDWRFEAPSGAPRWVKVAIPSGREGYVDGRAIQTFGEERLCARKDGRGRWFLSGYVGGGD
jgi:hypothetical protein